MVHASSALVTKDATRAPHLHFQPRNTPPPLPRACIITTATTATSLHTTQTTPPPHHTHTHTHRHTHRRRHPQVALHSGRKASRLRALYRDRRRRAVLFDDLHCLDTAAAAAGAE